MARCENRVGRFNKHTMQLQAIPVWPINASGHAARDLEHRFNWTSPLMMSPHDPDTLYCGMERLYKTTDDGKSWTAISPDLTRNDKSKQLRLGRADHQGHHQRRVLRHHLRHRGIAARARA